MILLEKAFRKYKDILHYLRNKIVRWHNIIDKNKLEPLAIKNKEKKMQ